jgi:cephalosporin hydroxylase
MSVYFRKKFPKFYGIYQEILGEIYYEFLGMGFPFRLISRKRLTDLEKNDTPPIEAANRFSGIGLYKSIRPYQVHQEISALFDIVKKMKPRVVCEIGSDKGGTLYLWSKVIPDDGMLIGIDLPRLYRKSLNRFTRRFVKEGQRIHFIRQDSHSLECFNRLKTVLNGKKIDFLFIDGDHSYEGVKQDFQLYSPLVRKGGIVGFHDIVKHDLPEDVCGVDKFWDEIKSSNSHQEIVENPDQRWAGIGLLHV